MSIIKTWKQKIEKRRIFKDRCEEFLTTLANFYMQEWKNIAKDIIDKNPEVKGFKISNSLSFVNKNIFIFNPNYELDIVDIAPNVFYEVIFGDLGENNSRIDPFLMRKENESAEKLIKEIIQNLDKFNKDHEFALKIHTSADSLYINGISISVPFSELKAMFGGN